MSYQSYQLARLEHELRLRRRHRRSHPLGWERPTLPRLRPRRPTVPRRAPRPTLTTHEYLQLEFTVDDRR